MKQLLFALAAMFLVRLCRGDYKQYCHGDPCPEYTVLETNEKYEKRSYVTTMWVSTPVEGQDSIHLIEATNRLKDFWNKQKSKGINMPNSWPVTITRRTSDNTVILSWFLPPGIDLQNSETNITLEQKDQATIYARYFSGQPTPSAVQENVDILKKDLSNAGITFDPQTSTGAFYESYFATSHNNEIWLYGQ